MKLTKVRILNYRSCKDVPLEIDGIHALVGANNAGKSSVLRALDFLFNPSVKSLNEESFWNKDTGSEIRVEAVFSDLTTKEKEALTSYQSEDGTFQMARTAKIAASKSGETEQDSEQGAEKIIIGQQYKKSMPEAEWLREENINSHNIEDMVESQRPVDCQRC